MPHETEIIIRSVRQPVLFGEHANPHEAAHKTNVRVWWFVALPVLTFLVGLSL